jgi:TRAP-type mannitol/chloroaromatic compound transport system substrate-binding protein
MALISEQCKWPAFLEGATVIDMLTNDERVEEEALPSDCRSVFLACRIGNGVRRWYFVIINEKIRKAGDTVCVRA